VKIFAALQKKRKLILLTDRWFARHPKGQEREIMLKAAQILTSEHALGGMVADVRLATVTTMTVIMTTGKRDGSG
jgi:hypothetical protein